MLKSKNLKSVAMQQLLPYTPQNLISSKSSRDKPDPLGFTSQTSKTSNKQIISILM